MPFSASITLRRENSRFKPCRGLRRLNFGLIDSPATSILVWKKVTPMARIAVTAKNGPAITTKVTITVLSRSFRILAGITELPDAM